MAFTSQDGITFLVSALFSYVPQASLLIIFGTRKPFYRAVGVMILQSCQPVSMHSGLHHGEAYLLCQWVQQIFSGRGSYKHLSKRHCLITSAGAPGVNLGTAHPVTQSACCSEHNFSLRYDRRWCSLGSCRGYVLWEMAFHGVADPLAKSQLWQQGCWCLSAVLGVVPKQLVNAPTPQADLSDFTERLFQTPRASSCSQSQSCCHRPDVFSLHWQIFL